MGGIEGRVKFFTPPGFPSHRGEGTRVEKTEAEEV